MNIDKSLLIAVKFMNLHSHMDCRMNILVTSSCDTNYYGGDCLTYCDNTAVNYRCLGDGTRLCNGGEVNPAFVFLVP